MAITGAPLEPVEIDPHNRRLLESLGRLRVLAWASELPAIASRTECYLDDFELMSRHWCIFHEGEPVAAARLSIHQRIGDVPDAAVYRDVFVSPPPSPIGSINRLVTHPRFRGRGLSRKLDEVRIRAATDAGCRCVIGATPSGESRVRAMTELGFRPVGEPVLDEFDWFLAGSLNQVVILPIDQAAYRPIVTP
ncbi:GNAT family N-acetyltransferase [bacterium]|nr:GNAT family N-acetyltransferase [bacterium]